jgi:hypothetical protein
MSTSGCAMENLTPPTRWPECSACTWVGGGGVGLGARG